MPVPASNANSSVGANRPPPAITAEATVVTKIMTTIRGLVSCT